MLIEREAELGGLSERLTEAREGKGGVVYVEAAAGRGKSRLLMDAAEIARGAGMCLLEARGRELEREYPFGVAIQLFEQHWLATEATAQSRLRQGPARRPGRLVSSWVDDLRPIPGDRWFAVIHGLFWLARDLVASAGEDGERCPLAVLVDDAHWADWPSLRFLAYLAARVEDLPVALIVAAGTGGLTADRRVLDALRDAAGGAVLRPDKLSVQGVAAVVRSELPEAGAPFWQACARVTDGNPFLLMELLAEVRRTGANLDAPTAQSLGELSLESAIKMVNSQLAAMPAEARSVAIAVAVLGDRVPLRRAALVAELDVGAASRSADELAAGHLFQPGAPLSFANPLISRAVRASISALERGQAHRRAVGALTADGAPAEQIAFHLLAAPTEGDRHAVELLRATARRALAAEGPDTAVRVLERALSEAAEPDVHAAVLEELRQAKLAAEGPWVLSRTLLPEHLERARAEGEAMLERLTGAPTPEQRITLAYMAVRSSLRGEHRTSVTDLAEMAWGAGELLHCEAPDATASSLLATALLFVDELERSLEICSTVLSAGLAHDWTDARAAAALCRTWALYNNGQITDALVAARAVLGAREDGQELHATDGAIAACRLQVGRLDEAGAALSMLSHPEAVEEIDLPALFEIRAQLRLAQMRPGEALEDALEAGRRSRSAIGPAHPGILAWRSTAALAHLALGEPRRAQRLAEEELELARSTDLTRVTIRSLRVLGLANEGERRLDLLAEAVSVGESYPTRLEYIHALIDFGAATRRANQRAAARKPLHRALELCRQMGATALAQRAEEEIAATGARSRRPTPVGVDALTPSERRVADLAAQGRTTREIAIALFVTPKTVEFHLRHIYRKLDVPSSRTELTRALRSGPVSE